MAGVASVMCSYSPYCIPGLSLQALTLKLSDLVNDTYACENDHTLNELLKKELGFQGCAFSNIMKPYN